MNRRWILAGIVLVAASAAPADVRIWAVDGLTRLDPLHAAPGRPEIKLAAARNEYEPFQIAVQADERVTVADVVVTDLLGPNGHKIPAKLAKRFREHCVYVRRPSPQSNARIGLYPDPLVPFVNPIDGKPLTEWHERNNKKGAKYDAIPRTVHPGMTEIFWIDIYVPADTPPGDYTGQVHVKFKKAPSIPVSLSLHVWNFALPDVPTVRSHFGGFGRVAAAHRVKPSSPEFRPIEQRYLTAMTDHRITPDVPRYLLPKAKPDGTIDATATHDKLAAFVKHFRVNTIQIPFGFAKDPAGENRELTKKYLAAMQAYLAQHGWLDGAYVYILDEPNDPDAYKEVRRRAAVVHEAAPKIRVLCTEQTKPSNPKWGDLYGAVDIWVPLWFLHDEPTARNRLAAGDRLWSYTALCQGGNRPLFWQIDFPLLNYRVWAWINYRYQMTGLLYWTSVYWGHVKDPWLDQPSFRLRYNGEGMLFYPGSDAGFDGPVVSMRLKQIREGMEDYEYLHLLAQKTDRQTAHAFAQRIGRTWLDWEKTPARLLAARADLAKAIESVVASKKQ